MDIQEYHINASQEEKHWWFKGRRLLLDALVRGYLHDRKIPKCDLALDVGCCAGSNAGLLRSYANRLVGVDSDEIAVRYCQGKAYDQVVQSSLERLAAEGGAGKADMVVAMDILEHLEDDLRGMQSIKDLLADRGIAIITVPAFPFLWSRQDVFYHHFRRYTRQSLLKIIEDSGLKVIRTTYFNAWLFLPIALARGLLRIWRPDWAKSENMINTPKMNYVLSRIFGWEISTIVRGLNYPFGVSLLAVVGRDGIEKHS